MLGIPNEIRLGDNMRLHRLMALLAITVALGARPTSGESALTHRGWGPVTLNKMAFRPD